MSVIPVIDLKEILAASTVTGTIATLDESGAPHAAPSPFLHPDRDGYLVHLELLETSISHRNLLRSIWFDRPVSISIFADDGRVVTVSGRVYKALVSGPLFSDYYSEVQSRLGDADLAAVWLIKPLQIRDESYALRKVREEELHPFFRHLDRLAVSSNRPLQEEEQV